MHLRDILPGCPVPFANNPEVDRIEFGARHSALLLTGARVDFTDFAGAMGTLKGALQACPTADLSIGIEANVLVARIEVTLGRPWGRQIDATLEQIQFAVNHYAVSDEWPEDIPRRPRRDKIQFGR